MLQVQVKSSDAPRVLAELIRSTQNEPGSSQLFGPEIEAQARLVRETQAKAAHDRQSWTTLDTVDFALLEPETDWTDV